MNGLGTGGGGTTHNTVSGDAVVVRPLLMAQHIEGIQLPPAPPDAPPNQGPPPSRVFVNRTKELTDLRDAARALAAGPEPRVLTVVGVGGVGKTQLVAQSVRRELMQLFPQGQLYVDLEDLRQDGVVAPAAGSEGALKRKRRVRVDLVIKPAQMSYGNGRRKGARRPGAGRKGRDSAPSVHGTSL
ncbi:hypothetical protein [Streptomyces cyaneofuscatus]|uniref:hypothetical protein n=1 Tax=Streptomyces cyaneofuscatus TaxID=66883 RepID=UPI0036AF8AB6